jgi:molybdopterin molybdotransferase
MIPSGADAMVMIEYAESFDEKSIAVYESAAPGAHVAQIGEDAAKGSSLLRRGTVLGPKETGALAAAGIMEVSVYTPLKLTLISTGDEVVPPEQSPGSGEIRDVNSFALAALAERSGYTVIRKTALKDDEALLEKTIGEAMMDSDVVAVSGGSSQGEKDVTAQVIGRIAKPGVLTHGLGIKPGKPTILGYDEASKTILAGLPGHPVSAMMVFTLIFGNLFQALTGSRGDIPIPARMGCNLPGSPGKALCQPVTLRRDSQAARAASLTHSLQNEAAGLVGLGYIAEPVFGKSGMIATLTKADGFILIGINTEGLQKDEPVWVFPF